MQFTTAFIAASAAALATAAALPACPAPEYTPATTTSAAPAASSSAASSPIASTDRFGVIAIRSGSAIQNSALQAAQGSLLLGRTNQNASCVTPANSATFYIADEELFLYAASATPQKVYVDRSGMGMGVIQYVTGAQPISANGETKGWKVENNALSFDGTGLQACPGSDGYSVWLQGLEKPAYQEGCLTFDNFIVKTENPDSCVYSQ